MLFLYATFGCGTQDAAVETTTNPAPSFMEPTTDAVAGVGCSWTPEAYETNAGLLGTCQHE